MPIRAENKSRYPKDWAAISKRIRFERAQNRCEECGVSGGKWGWRDQAGAFHPLPKRPLIEAGYTKPPFLVGTSDRGTIKVIAIVLTVAHLDHTPENCADDNLKALCQRCHNRYDAPERARGRRERRTSLAVVWPLFEMGNR